MLNGGTLNYFAVPWAVIGNPLPLFAVVAIEVVLMGAVEKFRKDGTGPPGYSPGVGSFDESIFNGLDNLYPGMYPPVPILATCQPDPDCSLLDSQIKQSAAVSSLFRAVKTGPKSPNLYLQSDQEIEMMSKEAVYLQEVHLTLSA